MYWFLEYITLQATPKFECKHNKDYVCMYANYLLLNSYNCNNMFVCRYRRILYQLLQL